MKGKNFYKKFSKKQNNKYLGNKGRCEFFKIET